MAPTLLSGFLGLLPLLSAGCPQAALHKRDTVVARAKIRVSLDTLGSSFGKCPTISDAAGGGTRSHDWWPCQLKLDVLRQFAPQQKPFGETSIILPPLPPLIGLKADLKADLKALMTQSQPRWPVDFGHYGGLFIRLTWHSAGTYRAMDGRGGGGMVQFFLLHARRPGLLGRSSQAHASHE
ncbi:heme peroxidase [Parathielavia appendiculata]|uniref:Heme peroxidase n=1 Tax=Parathielavia appendiculata TaxID=2587402 RepID=A0AAN6TRB6_9PEZI|nr:heme peroxidase [Parathielavia appendiculata]